VLETPAPIIGEKRHTTPEICGRGPPGFPLIDDGVGGHQRKELTMETMAEASGISPSGPISMRALLEAGVHFGHNTGRWNPKMKQYIFGARNGIHIIDLQHTVKLFRQAFQAVVDTTSRGETILFVGTKKQAQDVIVEEATRSSQHYVTQRWLGGTLTNFRTVKGSLERLRGLEKMEEDGTLFALTKREQVMIKRDRDKLMKSLGGIKGLSKVPGMLFVIDPHKEHIAVDEARKLEIPVVAITDTNCDPDQIDYVIPGNDDAIRAIKLFASKIADAAILGSKVWKETARSRGQEREETGERVIHVSSGGDGPRVEMSTGGSMFNPEASASPDQES
jgi:small subunit ribosomal protein S2